MSLIRKLLGSAYPFSYEIKRTRKGDYFYWVLYKQIETLRFSRTHIAIGVMYKHNTYESAESEIKQILGI